MLEKLWSPTIHYAQTQTLPQGKLNKRRLYDSEILYVNDGIAATEINNKRYVLNKGNLIFLAPGIYHQNEVVSDQANFIGIHFSFLEDSEIISEDNLVVNEQAVLHEKFTEEIIYPPFKSLSTELIYEPSNQCIQLMFELVHEYNQRAPGYELICKGYMLQILTHLLRTQFTKRLEEKSVHSLSIRKLIQDIQNKPQLTWNNKELAKRMNVSEDYVSKLFKEIIGMTPTEFIASTRINLARKYLRETQLSIETIGEKVGYDDAHYFSRIFKRVEGISPRDYRKLSRIL